MSDKEYINDILNKEKELVDKYGWYFHFVTDDKQSSYIDAHTHHLQESFDHIDFQIVLKLDYDTICRIFNNLVEYVEYEGEITEEDEMYDIIENYALRFKLVNDQFGKEILRVIFPDSLGRFPDDKDCDPIYKRQLEI